MRVEFYGIPRLRAGVPFIDIELNQLESLRNILQMVAQRCPELAHSCLVNGWLASAYTLNIDGRQFVSDPETVVADHQTIILMSSDAGG